MFMVHMVYILTCIHIYLFTDVILVVRDGDDAIMNNNFSILGVPAVALPATDSVSKAFSQWIHSVLRD